jgi:putative transposase
VLNVKVLPANISDSLGARILLCEISTFLVCLRLVFADSGYDKTELFSYMQTMTDAALLIVKKLDGQVGFIVQPWRWIVERTFAWFGHNRRLSKDYEYTFESSENFIYIAMISKMLKKLGKVN